MIEELKETREIMEDYPQIRNLPLHITEFNSSYVPVCPVHDTDFHAAYIARILSEAGEYADSYSYWTFSDVFEEQDVPKAVFHGGFGLVALNSIKKPTFYAFEFFSRAGKELLYRDENLLVTRDEERYVIIGWNPAGMRKNKKNAAESYSLKLPSMGEKAVLLSKEVGGSHGNPLKTWSNLGKPRSLTEEEVAVLRAAAEPLQKDARLSEEKGLYEVELEIPLNHLCMLEIRPVEDRTESYAGYDEGFRWIK
jgi:xylan 1,4-beta-xylosidase